MYVVGQNGRVLYSPFYSGMPFGKLTQGTEDLKSICAVPSTNKMLSVGTNSTLLQHVTTNFVVNKNLFLQEITDINFMNGLNGSIIASNFTVRQTNDGGTSWKTALTSTHTQSLSRNPTKIITISPTELIIGGTTQTDFYYSQNQNIDLIAVTGTIYRNNISSFDKVDNLVVFSSKNSTTSYIYVLNTDLINNGTLLLGSIASSTIKSIKITPNKNIVVTGSNGLFRYYQWGGNM